MFYIPPGSKASSQNVQPWTLVTESTRCRLNITNAFHHQEIFASVKCFNQIELHSSASVGPLVVLLQPPSSQEGKVVFIVPNEIPDTLPGLQIQSETNRLQLAWFNLGDNHDNKTFLYHVKAGELPVTEWMNTSYNYADIDLDLHDGVTYTAEVIAMDVRQQQSETISGSLLVDSRRPVLTGIDSVT